MHIYIYSLCPKVGITYILLGSQEQNQVGGSRQRAGADAARAAIIQAVWALASSRALSLGPTCFEAQICVDLCTHMYIYMYHRHVHTRIHMHMHMHIQIHSIINIHLLLHLHLHLHLYMYIDVDIRIHMHIHGCVYIKISMICFGLFAKV